MMDVALDHRTRVLLVLVGLFVIALGVGDLISPKLFDIGLGPLHATMSAGMIAFPLTFVVTDILNEFYGARVARFVTFLAFAFAVLVFLLVTVAIAMPWSAVIGAPGYAGVMPQEFDKVFGGSQRILLASLCAFLVGQLGDIYVFTRLKKLTANRKLWLRVTGSTVVSQFLDTVILQYIAWTGVLPGTVIMRLLWSSYAVKFLIAVGLTPVLYAANALLERRFGLRPAEVS
ncbi:MAG: queuosine precursor transporter [Clostridia bacterium]|nr:queuosine precursor transporter [Deltaproteobacteria bacterium]